MLNSAAIVAAATGRDTDLDRRLAASVRALYQSNLTQWRQEDTARDASDDTTVAAAKRRIDRQNLRRVDLIVTIDELCAAILEPAEDVPLLTDTPGSAIDQLTVLLIRSHVLGKAAGRSIHAADRMEETHEQLVVHREALDVMLADLAEGRRRFAVRRNVKSYGQRQREQA